MKVPLWRCIAAVMLCAVLVAGCASAPARADAPAQYAQAATPSASVNGQSPASAAVSAPVASNAPVISDPQAAFLDGYRAYLSHDNLRASERLKYAADNFSALGDYALYYLALAQNGQGDLAGSADTLERLVNNYLESVMRDRADLNLAETLIKLGRNQEASAVAATLLARLPEPSIEQGARIVEAKALIPLGNPKAAYTQAMELRDKYPRSDSDAEARVIVHSILASNPEVAETGSLGYHRAESALLLREGQLTDANEQASAGLTMAPEESIRAELVWVRARALRAEPERAKRAIFEYLQIAPRWPDAPAALEALALIYWHDEQYDLARAQLTRLVANFPASQLAPGAMLRIGKIFEEEHKLDSARAQYRKLAARYPNSEAATEARFRAPWTLYLARSYRSASAGFESARAHAKEAIDRDMCEYWRARSLEKAGDTSVARALFVKLAESTESNYYPELASRRVGASKPQRPAPSPPHPAFNGMRSLSC